MFQVAEDCLMELELAQDHKNIVPLHGYCEEPVALVYEYMEGGSLQEVLDSETIRSSFTLEQRVDAILQIAHGLAYLHDKDICHRDCKPENILLKQVNDGSCASSKYVVKLGDLGVSKSVSQSVPDISSCVKGTLHYLDPHYLEAGNYSKCHDVYSFGVVVL